MLPSIKINNRLQQIKGNEQLPYGGINMLFVGVFIQLVKPLTSEGQASSVGNGEERGRDHMGTLIGKYGTHSEKTLKKGMNPKNDQRTYRDRKHTTGYRNTAHLRVSRLISSESKTGPLQGSAKRAWRRN